ncbi:hypothetical protein [Nostoc sp.]|uniref:hypothetical protein n=1 Tax=Nostoc sp. TaxID=1180 RepID=UPI002FF72944
MNMEQISSKRKILIYIALLVTVNIVIIKLIDYFKNAENLSNFFTWGFAIAGLLFAGWQIAIALNANEETKVSGFQTSISELRKDSDLRDYNQERELSEIKQDLAVLQSQQELYRQEGIARLELHRSEIGHEGLMKQLFKIQYEISDLRAALDVATERGEVYLKIDRLTSKVDDLAAIVEGNKLDIKVQDWATD